MKLLETVLSEYFSQKRKIVWQNQSLLDFVIGEHSLGFLFSSRDWDEGEMQNSRWPLILTNPNLPVLF